MIQFIRRNASRFSEPAHSLESIVVRGYDEVLKLQSVLANLCVRCGRPGEWDNLSYFFSLPYARNKSPYLILFVDRPGLTPHTLSVSDLTAAVLTFEYRLWNLHTGVFISDDFSARRTVIAPDQLQAEIARRANRLLMDQGAAISLISYLQSAAVAIDRKNHRLSASKNQTQLSATRQREIFTHLSLEKTMDATMANLGKRTRSHMRYYRRRAEKELGCTFVPNIAISKAEFQQFNRECAFSTSDQVAAVRYDAVASLPNSFLAGIRDKDGQWLSMVGGHKNFDFINIYWQMNLSRLPGYSLSTVMRSFLIEYEISCGTRKLSIEGGTPHPMHLYFARESVIDVLIKRKNLYTSLIDIIAKSPWAKKTFLAELINTRDLSWEACNQFTEQMPPPSDSRSKPISPADPAPAGNPLEKIA